MAEGGRTSGSELFIVDNSDRDWKVARYLKDWAEFSRGTKAAFEEAL